MRGIGRGNLRVAKTPPLQSALAGRSLRGMPHRPSFAPMGGSTGMANGRITTRRCKNRRSPIGGRHAGCIVCAWRWGRNGRYLGAMRHASPTVGAGSSRFSRRFSRPPDSPFAKIPPHPPRPPGSPCAKIPPCPSRFYPYLCPKFTTTHEGRQHPRGRVPRRHP